jgi:hypothetical protein
MSDPAARSRLAELARAGARDEAELTAMLGLIGLTPELLSRRARIAERDRELRIAADVYLSGSSVSRQAEILAADLNLILTSPSWKADRLRPLYDPPARYAGTRREHVWRAARFGQRVVKYEAVRTILGKKGPVLYQRSTRP